MKRRRMKGIPQIIACFGDVDPDPLAPLHRRLGIKTKVHRQAILHDVTNGIKNSGINWSFDPVTRVGPNNHLYRVNITLAAV